MAGVLRGLDYLHKKKIIHRDIKVPPRLPFVFRRAFKLCVQRMTSAVLLSLCVCVCHITAHLRQAGNVLLNNQGQAKLADFGVAIQLQSTFQKRATVTGSPYWMAPECVDRAYTHTSRTALLAQTRPHISTTHTHT